MAALFNVTITTTDVGRSASFWRADMAMTVTELREDLARLAPAGQGAPNLLILRSAAPATGVGRVHLDLSAGDVPTEVGRLVRLGARLVDGGTASQPSMRTANGISWVVLADPDGNEFCLGDEPKLPSAG